MKRSDAPKKQPVPFGINGPRENLLPTTPAGDNTASYDQGFPPVTMILKAAGGLPPKGQDMNQILYELSNLSRWASTGALNSFDSSFAAAIGGYPKSSVLISDDGSTIFINAIDGNQSNPDLAGTGWINFSNQYLNRSNPFGDIKADGAVNTAKANLGISGFNTIPGLSPNLFSSMTSPNGMIDVFVTNDGQWGAQNNTTGQSAPLTVGRGGTNSTTAEGARANLGLGSVSVENTLPVSKGGTGSTNAASARNSLGIGSVATENIVPVAKGGTGASNVNDARVALGVQSVFSQNNETPGAFNAISSPDGNLEMFIANGGQWGGSE
ncbi:Uncharacterised protein [Cedecea lapagei]|uniref:Tail fiber protein n=2 Tax=Cedecea lapagei TaxID=158823 RepID=A0A447V5I1_9ENTR|nr:Uncharacterised protein [Cedecea lapagei]